MSDRLNKAAPPPIPRDAFKQPPVGDSPWDQPVVSSVAKPAKQKLELPMWAGRPLAEHGHANQLDLDAAVNEFGLKMPREQAEDEAYHQYLYHPSKGQHAQAAFHHLSGMKAAHASGDMDAARKHSLMYNLHAKALGKSPVDAARELSMHIKEPAKVYRFKAHRGDAFAVQAPEAETPKAPVYTEGGVVSSAPKPQLTKREREALYMLYLMGSAALKKAQGPDIESRRYGGGKVVKGKVNPHFKYDDFLPNQNHTSMLTVTHDGGNRIVASLGGGYGSMEALKRPDGKFHLGYDGGANHPETAHLAPHLYRALWHYTNSIGNPMDENNSFLQDRATSKVQYAQNQDLLDRVYGPQGNSPSPPSTQPKPEPKHDTFDPMGTGARARNLEIDKAEGKIVGSIPGATPPKQPKGKKLGYNDLDTARAKKWARSQGIEPHELESDDKPTKKGELSAKPKHCKCTAYHFPHRHGGGKCMVVKP
jgi:hypothetical protein